MRKQLGLIGSLFEYWQGQTHQDELDFYMRYISVAGGPILEGSCGTGRILLPVHLQGYDIEGVEASKELLDICQQRAHEHDIQVKLHHMSMDAMQLEKKYALIFETLGSFQFIYERTAAQIALARLKEHLREDGTLIISLILPWVDKDVQSDRWRIVRDVQDKQQNIRFVRRERCSHDPIEQLLDARVRFEKWQGKDILELEERNLRLRWYSQYEFTLMLEKEGFKNIKMYRSYQEGAPHVPGLMLFVATH